MFEAATPWQATLTQPQHMIITYFLVVAAFALFAGTIRSWLTRGEVGSRYRPAVVARLGIAAIATLSYLVLIVEFARGYSLRGGVYQPNAEAIMSFAPRYMDWSVTVPLLSIELLAVCTLVGATHRRVQGLALAGSFFMILSGFIGAFVVDNGESVNGRIIWGSISAVFWVFTNVVLIWAVRQSYRFLTPQAAALLRDATVLLLVGWVIYPIVFAVEIFGIGGAWTTAIQVALCVTDVVIKIGFGGLIHRVAKLRTAEDVRAGDDVHPESIWASQVKLSDAGVAHEVYLAEGSSVHPSRERPTAGSAVAAEPPPDIPEWQPGDPDRRIT
jgi:bacteriorhodopsin